MPCMFLVASWDGGRSTAKKYVDYIGPETLWQHKVKFDAVDNHLSQMLMFRC